MKQAETYLLSLLRNKDTDRATFRRTARKLSELLALRALEAVAMKEVSIETTLAKTTGLTLKDRIVIIPILRAGISMLEPFLSIFPDAAVGIVGLQRDKATAKADWYYENIPPLTTDDQIIIIDPMIATGGTGYATLAMLKGKGAHLDKALYMSMVSAPEGIAVINHAFPHVQIITAATDTHLNDKKFIVPGLGDYGDRYFGTE